MPTDLIFERHESARGPLSRRGPYWLIRLPSEHTRDRRYTVGRIERVFGRTRYGAKLVGNRPFSAAELEEIAFAVDSAEEEARERLASDHTP